MTAPLPLLVAVGAAPELVPLRVDDADPEPADEGAGVDAFALSMKFAMVWSPVRGAFAELSRYNCQFCLSARFETVTYKTAPFLQSPSPPS